MQEIDQLKQRALQDENSRFADIGVNTPEEVDVKSELPHPDEAAKDNKYFKVLRDYGKVKLIGVFRKVKGNPIGVLLWIFLTVPGIFGAAEFRKTHLWAPTQEWVASVTDKENPTVEFVAHKDGYVWLTDGRNLEIIDEIAASSSSPSSSSSSEDLVFTDTSFIPASSSSSSEDLRDIKDYV